MFALFDDAGKFLAGRVMSEADASLQVELDSGKRVKVKSANVLLKFEQPAPAVLLTDARKLADDIDLDLAWEFAPEGEFGFADLARDYFDAKAGVVQQAAALFRLYDAPHYFRRAGKGQFKKAPEEIVKAALLGIERKRQQQLQIEAWAEELVKGSCPQPIQDQIYKILFKPDKNGPEYKAVVEASKRSHKAPLDLLQGAGAITSAYQFHWKRFLFENFPKGTGFPALTAPEIKDELALSPAHAFSIDDSQTTEIDDALSVQGLGTGTVIFGVHIAAPGLAITPDSAVDKVARERLSTVYMPGWKLTMLPDDVVQAYTLIEGRDCPAVSIYFTMDEATFEIKAKETKLERVHIASNLRHDKLDGIVTDATLSGEAPADYLFAPELAFTWRLAKHLKAQREVVRGKPENFNRPDYNFRLKPGPSSASSPTVPQGDAAALGNGPAGGGERTEAPNGSELVQISVRARGSSLDLIVAEAMILANSAWGGWLAELGLPGIYRSQASLAPGIKVRMGVKALPHAGMGVAQYTWATSPLRRYVDLVNQWQIIACARHGRTAALAAPFKPKDAALFSIISSFESAYAAYNGFQNGIERFWTLRWLQQNGTAELTATVMKDGLVRADDLPLVFKALGCEPLPRGSHVKVRITGLDEMTLDVHATLIERMDEAAAAEESEGDDDELEAAAAPIALAIDVNETEPAEAASSN
ncbi:exoribonuclease-2 [Pelomonas saccharophila]|uniref:Exoribonuclease-2 n=1 Tax=Roseateles saccharophilus TaxID=304 RepID=A0ABU1YJ89_ROSSA|nr:RNB domain-containing ribonuclease [Roseateles saccharophilus]MDR7268921.1 exoribonuclease-2 [Roseateles saccharophilus]